MSENIGHNSVAGDRLKSFVERIERIEEERKALAGDVRDILEEAASDGFNKKALREILKLRRMAASVREALQSDIDIYMNALGMLRDTPLGEAAVQREFKKDGSGVYRDPDVVDIEQLLPAPAKALPAPNGSAAA